MRNHSSLNNLFGRDRKILYIVLSVVMISILSLTVVYAALSTTLNINGNAEISAASWDIYLDNVVLNSKSATTIKPIIINKTTVSFTTTLSEPGDFYEFTVDVVNNGTIDAMIDSVTKMPELSVTQAKYLNYDVVYQNGESITTKQLVSKNSFVRLKVRIGFRSDISASDIPEAAETLNLSFKVNYVQSDEQGIVVRDDGVFKLNVVSGDINTVGSEIAIGDEHFYIMKNNGENVTLLSRYNITNDTIPRQSTGVSAIAFSLTGYWASSEINGLYVYDSNSLIYNYVESYKMYLESLGADVEEARLIKIEELETFGCNRTNNSCSEAPEWIYETSYWTGSATDGNSAVWCLNSFGYFGYNTYSTDIYSGMRPVIILNI